MGALRCADTEADDEGHFEFARKCQQERNPGHDIILLVSGRIRRDQEEIPEIPLGGL